MPVWWGLRCHIDIPNLALITGDEITPEGEEPTCLKL